MHTHQLVKALLKNLKNKMLHVSFQYHINFSVISYSQATSNMLVVRFHQILMQ